MINICILGAGNISNTRHIPAIKKNPNLHIEGVISDDPRKLSRTRDNYPEIKNEYLIERENGIDEKAELAGCDWFAQNVDAVIIGTPPKQHYPLVKTCLLLGKHVLVEKPMMMEVEQCEEVIKIAKENNLILNIMHSFQFASGILELKKRVSNGELGDIESIVEIQLTNRRRRLPVWYDELPLGLFYDEAAHFFYSAMTFGNGPLKVLNAHAQFNAAGENTPKFLEAQLLAGSIPVQMFMNFNSPICEWGLLLLGDKKIAVYDYFKDILILMDNDQLHLAKDVLKASLQFSFGFWKGFLKNGVKMMRKKLLYGHDIAIGKFADAIVSGNSDLNISGEQGRDVVKAMCEVVSLATKEKKLHLQG